MQAEASQSHSWWERLLNLISVVKPGEGKSCILLTLNACILMSAYYLLKVIREPLILAYGGAEYKSYATAIQAGLLIFIVPLFSVLFHHFAENKNRSIIISNVLAFFILNLVMFAALQYLQINVGMVFYIWLGIFSVMVVAQFWAFAADLYNVRSGQRLFVILAVGATFGAWLGSRVAGPIFPHVGIVGIMMLAVALLLISVFLTRQTDGTIPEASANEEPVHHEDDSHRWLDGFLVVFKNNYLLMIATFVVVLVFINSTGEYILAHLVNEHTKELVASGEITDVEAWQGQFYSTYYSWITLGSFILQLFFVSRIFKWVGLRGAILVLPIIMLIGYGLMLFIPIFSFIRIAMIAENSANYSVQNTTRHALFLPVPRKLKYLGKTTIETFFYRFGDLLYGAFIFVGIEYFQLGVSGFILSNFILAACLFTLAWKVGHNNLLEVQKTQGNSPPQVMAMIPHLQMPSGSMSKFSISECTFVDPDIGDALKFHARRVSGQPLPKWIKFDRMTRTFTFNPPVGHEGELNIEVIASDFEGLTASSKIKVTFVHAHLLEGTDQ
ncbi:ATP translocase [Aliikangiella coralliicola]|uniref:ATP translocase n=1 Tax=Aliikangiella coralliicola TaxID=2592383 RepID=A0A545UJK0_9GAMM|nr:ATP translocase [Aliikangiella coralliicola]TQV89644.1 ATP translocase [Aliikangiella coralliicola]